MLSELLNISINILLSGFVKRFKSFQIGLTNISNCSARMLSQCSDMNLLVNFPHLIIFLLSCIFSFGGGKDVEQKYKEMFGCEAGSLPFRYLGIQIHHREIQNAEWNPVETRFARKLGYSIWTCRNNNIFNKMTCINFI
jgi:hypothetical protein